VKNTENHFSRGDAESTERKKKTEEDLIEFALLVFRILSPFSLDFGLCFLLRALLCLRVKIFFFQSPFAAMNSGRPIIDPMT